MLAELAKGSLHTPYDGSRKREADGEGFEPPVGFPTSVFKTGALNRSAIHPFSRFVREKKMPHKVWGAAVSGWLRAFLESASLTYLAKEIEPH